MLRIIQRMVGKVFQKSAAIQPEERGMHKGVLRPDEFNQHIAFQHYAPSKDLALFVEHIWTLSWDLPEGIVYHSPQLLPHPHVNIFFTENESGIQGVYKGMLNYVAEGKSKIAGVSFKPGGFYPFWQRPVSELTDKNAPLTRVFPQTDQAYARQLLALKDTALVLQLEALLRSKKPKPDGNIILINKIFRLLGKNKSIQTAEAVVAECGRSERTIQYIFQTYAGVGLKWVLLRNRLLDAAERARLQAKPNWVRIALDLGYNSQSHFIREFKKMVGQSPVQYIKMSVDNNYPVLAVPDTKIWEDWLATHHDNAPGVWLKIAKKASGLPTVTHDDVLEVALCYGWIDGLRRGLDETYFLQKFTPRRPKSTWSKRNIEKIAKLTLAGKMRPSGIAEVEAAKKDGRWSNP